MRIQETTKKQNLIIAARERAHEKKNKPAKVPTDSEHSHAFTDTSTTDNEHEESSDSKDDAKYFPQHFRHHRHSTRSGRSGPHSMKTSTGSNTRTTLTLSDDLSLSDDANWMEKILKSHLLVFLNLIFLVLGISLGFLLKHVNKPCYWTRRRITYVRLPAQIFENILSCLKLPIISSSIIAAIGSMDLQTCAFIGKKALIHIISTGLISAFLGSLITFRLGTELTQPNQNCSHGICGNVCPMWIQFDNEDECVLQQDVYFDTFRNFIPPNMIQIYRDSRQTLPDLSSPSKKGARIYDDCSKYNKDKSTNRPGLDEFDFTRTWTESANVLGIYFISVFIGVTIVLLGDSAKDFLNLFVSISEVFILMANWALRLGPIGDASMLTGLILSHASPFQHSASLNIFILTAACCLLFQSFVVLPLIYWIFTRKSPFKFYKTIFPALTTAFFTSSSTGTIPVTIKSLEDRSRLEPRVVRLIAPILAILNANGTITFCSAGVSYVLLRHRHEESFLRQLYIVFATFLMTMTTNTGLPVTGALSVPAILSVFGFQSHHAFIVVPATWMLDPLITVTNVVGDCVCAALINHAGEKKLKFLNEAEEKTIKEVELADANEQWGTKT